MPFHKKKKKVIPIHRLDTYTMERIICLAAENGDISLLKSRLNSPNAPAVDCFNEVSILYDKTKNDKNTLLFFG